LVVDGRAITAPACRALVPVALPATDPVKPTPSRSRSRGRDADLDRWRKGSGAWSVPNKTRATPNRQNRQNRQTIGRIDGRWRLVVDSLGYMPQLAGHWCRCPCLQLIQPSRSRGRDADLDRWRKGSGAWSVPNKTRATPNRQNRQNRQRPDRWPMAGRYCPSLSGIGAGAHACN